MDVTIRALQQDDETQWRRLWTAYLDFYETTVSEAVYSATFQRNCDPDRPDQNALLAVGPQGPVGLAHYIFHPHNWRLEKTCYLQDLYVDPDMRGAGLGRRLIEAVYAAADTAGCPSVYWLTQEFNHNARQLYDRVGRLTPFIKYDRG